MLLTPVTVVSPALLEAVCPEDRHQDKGIFSAMQRFFIFLSFASKVLLFFLSPFVIFSDNLMSRILIIRALLLYKYIGKLR